MCPRQVNRAVFAAYDAETREVKPVERPELVVEPKAPKAKPPVEPAVEPVKRAGSAAPEVEPGTRDVAERLCRTGVSRSFALEIARHVRDHGLRGAYAIDGAAALIRRLYRRAASPSPSSGTARVAFVGMSGSGKTTAVAKLGRQMAKTGRSVAFASLEPGPANAPERVSSVERDRDRMEVPFAPIGSAMELEALLSVQDDLDVLLVDTPGVSPFDEATIEDLAKELAGISRLAPLECYLVVPAHLNGRALDRMLDKFAPLGITAAIVTKLDETDAPGAVLEHLKRRGLPVAFFADGADTRAQLIRPEPRHFADLLLRGRCTG